MLDIKNLWAKRSEGEEAILQGIDLQLPKGQVHAIMGPNGSGKSTMAQLLAGKEGYDILSGSVLYCGQDLLAMKVEERARAGVFLAFQYPVEIPGLTVSVFLRHAVNAVRKARGEKILSPLDFIKWLRPKAAQLHIDDEMLGRAVNDGFSGGEKKRFEALQMILLEPKLIILDETDSGLDIDAMKVVADAVNSLRDGQRSFLVITHYQRLLHYIQPDVVWVLAKGRMVEKGDKQLAEELEQHGYAKYLSTDNRSTL
ncbi:MAG: Fe-S cluster assembly ATPase SufC [Alphaproteobacteria bacterium]|nr:Fe-S cluster assembly ATPase SufC [Alphaproteobacteria bacterium]